MIARNNSEKRLAQIEAAHEARERQIKDHEQARTALTERNNALTKTLKVRETALARGEEKIATLTERNGHLEADIQVSRTNIEKRVEDLNSALQREHMERAVVEGALERRARTIPYCKAKSRLSDTHYGAVSSLARHDKNDAPPYIMGNAHASYCCPAARPLGAVGLVRSDRMDPSGW
jgi:chromosome segregation ATPase